MKTVNSPQQLLGRASMSSSKLRGHLQIARADHWIKNVFVLPGIIIALSLDRSRLEATLPLRIFVGILAVCLVSSSNYVLNELLDASLDRKHPRKNQRPVPLGQVSIPWAYFQWIVLMIAAIGLGLTISVPFTLSLLGLWIMGCFYNVPPLRCKDLPYLDVPTEAMNNPLRLLAGWYITKTTLVPPVSLLISYWMIGCYFMAIKRYAEFRNISKTTVAEAYRKSFAFYSEKKLLISIMFYGSLAMLFLGAFIMRYRFEMVLAFPLVAVVMSVYLSLAFEEDSAAQNPESLYREVKLVVPVVACALLMVFLLFVDLPILQRIFPSSLR